MYFAEKKPYGSWNERKYNFTKGNGAYLCFQTSFLELM